MTADQNKPSQPSNSKTSTSKADTPAKIPDFIIEIVDKQTLSKSETPRANIIIAASYVDDLLTKLLKKTFIKPPDSTDKLFDSFGPLYNFGSKIELAYRMGAISSDFAWVLHEIRKLRDECAHSHEAKDFTSGRIKDLIDAAFSKIAPESEQGKPTVEKFDGVFTTVYLRLWSKINAAKEVNKPTSEF